MLDGGDRFHCSNSHKRGGKRNYRDASYVRVWLHMIFLAALTDTQTFTQYDVLEDKNKNNRRAPVDFVPVTYYGQVLNILEIPLSRSKRCKIQEDRMWLLAEIMPCITEAYPGTEIYRHKTFGTPIIVNLESIEGPIGRIYDRGHWVIVDRGGGLNLIKTLSQLQDAQSRAGEGEDNGDNDSGDD